MICDFRTYDGPGTIACDLCIIGGGPAGMAVASTFLGQRHKVVLAESGGLEIDAEVQALCRCESVNGCYPWVDTLQLRALGGATGVWGAECAPLDPIAFTDRPWVRDSDWPIDRATLLRYYPDAQEFLGLGPFDYDAHRWAQRGLPAIPFDPGVVTSAVGISDEAPACCGALHAEDFRRSGSVQLLLHANAVNLATDANGSRITSVTLCSLDGKAAVVRAGAYVLACGGIENARLMLASNGASGDGVGNRHDMVGRYFMEHRGGVMAMVATDHGVERFLPYITGVPVEDARVIAKALLPVEIQRRERLLQASVRFGWGGSRRTGYRAFARAAKAIKEGRRVLPSDAWTAARDIGGLVMGAISKARRDEYLWLGVECEPEPNADSRVLLSPRKDRLGLPLARIDWRPGLLEKPTSRMACRLVAGELARLGLGRPRIDDWLMADDASWPEPIANAHHMGTTRMGIDPKRSVVDADCRVHGVSNLYVAGSSVFPTGGYTSPTLTLTALALRLGEHLASVMPAAVHADALTA